MNDFMPLITNFGFPIAVTAFLLIRIEKKLDDLNNAIINLAENKNAANKR